MIESSPDRELLSWGNASVVLVHRGRIWKLYVLWIAAVNQLDTDFEAHVSRGSQSIVCYDRDSFEDIICILINSAPKIHRQVRAHLLSQQQRHQFGVRLCRGS